MSERVVTVTATIGSGQVVRWFGSVLAAEHGDAIVSASRDGVMGHGGYMFPGDFEAAWDAVQQYRKGGRETDLRHLATHRRRGMFGPLEPVARAAS